MELSTQAVSLLTHYSFDLGGTAAEVLVTQWQRVYGSDWVRLAVVEALYQGRYKACSVEQILRLWQRRGEPLHHFNLEFERLVCSHFVLEVPGDTPDPVPETEVHTKGSQDLEGIQVELETTPEPISLSTSTIPLEILPPSPLIPFSADPEITAVRSSIIKHTSFYQKLKAMIDSNEII